MADNRKKRKITQLMRGAIKEGGVKKPRQVFSRSRFFDKKMKGDPNRGQLFYVGEKLSPWLDRKLKREEFRQSLSKG